jgi:GH25 family lysozyme M1 (1,4-beta-N-acetylmuramidase)
MTIEVGAPDAPHIDACLARQTPKVPVSADPGEPYLMFDLYPFDLGETPNFSIPEHTDVDGDGDSDFVGGILKATDGVSYGYTAWFIKNFQRLKESERYGTSWFRGAYHYLQFLQPGATQADYYLSTVEKAGGWDSGVIMPIVDIEFGGERAANRTASTQQIVDQASAFAYRVKEKTGRRCMLYGRGANRDRSITSKMGCDCVWNPAYTERMVTSGLIGTLPDGKTAPWTIDDITLWQAVGDGVSATKIANIPKEIKGFGKVDISVYIDGARKPTLASFKARLI